MRDTERDLGLVLVIALVTLEFGTPSEVMWVMTSISFNPLTLAVR